MNQPPASLFRAAFLADSLCLGSHWVYNQGKIARIYPEGVHDFDNPHSSYHPNRKQGEFTHYGDQMLIVAKAIAASTRWSLPVFRSLWQSEMNDFDGYLDGASKTTLENLAANSPSPASDSNDLAGASRFAPILFQDGATLEEKVTAAREQTALSHGDLGVIDAAEFFVRATAALLEGQDLPTAFATAASAPYQTLPAQEHLQQATAALAEDDYLKKSAEFGLTCHLPEAFPATLYFALRWHQNGARLSSEQFLNALSENALAGGDNSARAIPLAVFLAASGCQVPANLWQKLSDTQTLTGLETILTCHQTRSEKVTFKGANGDQLDASLEIPAGPIQGYALFAHCFTCGKASHAANQISRALAAQGFATLRFDFTGLGNSDGDFANTSFLSNVQDLVAAANHLRDHFQAPTLLVGHSLGGAAILAAAGEIPDVTHLATLGAPHDPSHVTHLFADDLPKIQAEGHAEVTLAGRKFNIGERFLNDLTAHDQDERIGGLNRNLLILHAPTDSIVGIENAGKIYSAAKHPKSFLSLPKADHLLTNPTQAQYAANLIATWVSQ